MSVCVLLARLLTATAAAVMPSSKLQEHTGSDKAWVWSAVDYADGEHKVELFCIRFGTPESELGTQTAAQRIVWAVWAQAN